MFGLNIPLPDFWIVYFSAFWVLVGSATAPVTFRHKGQPTLLGIVAGAVLGVLSAIVFVVLLGASGC